VSPGRRGKRDERRTHDVRGIRSRSTVGGLDGSSVGEQRRVCRIQVVDLDLNERGKRRQGRKRRAEE